MRIAVAAAVLAAGAGACIGSTDAEDTVKSAAVWGFLRYSEWAASTGPAITVGVVGRPSFAQVLRQTLAGKTVQNRPVRVVEFKSDPRCCQLLYFGTSRATEIKPILDGLPPRVLTIGEDDHFLEYGGAVNLFIEDGHIAFETSLDALDHSKVAISSSLLRLGQIRERGKGKIAR